MMGMADAVNVVDNTPLPPAASNASKVTASIPLSPGVMVRLGLRTLPSLWPSPKLAGYARSMSCPNPAFLRAGFNEPSLVFLVGTHLALENGAAAAAFLAGGPCRMAFVEGRMAQGFADRASIAG